MFQQLSICPRCESYGVGIDYPGLRRSRCLFDCKGDQLLGLSSVCDTDGLLWLVIVVEISKLFGHWVVGVD